MQWHLIEKSKISFHLVQLGDGDGKHDLPAFPNPKETGAPGGPPEAGAILPVPVGVRPTLAKYRSERERERERERIFFVKLTVSNLIAGCC